jgi:iron complex outermembrane receptor protein
MLDEVVVTATRRETNVQDTPLSIQAVSGEKIEEQHIDRMEDLVLRTPGVNFVYFSPSNQFPAIRASLSSAGERSPAADQGVSILIDDVVVTGVADISPELFDLDRVEILKGPQGTLFGRNSTGGAIAVYSRKPQFVPEIRIQGTYGSFNLMELKGFATGPLSENVAAKLAISIRKRDDYIPNHFGGENGMMSSISGRGQLLFRPRDDLDVLVGLDFLHDDSSGKLGYLVGNFQPSLYPELYYGFDKVNQADNGSTKRDILGFVGRADWRLEGATLTSITGYRSVDVVTSSSEVSDPVNDFPLTEVSEDRQFTQELRLASPGEETFDWTVGLYFLHAQKLREENRFYHFQPTHLLAGFGASTTPFPSQVAQNVNITSYAAFGEVTWNITDKLALTGGGRYSTDEKSGHTHKDYSSTYVGPPLDADFSESWSAFTPKATLSYTISDDIMLFATAARGFKSGGFTQSPTTIAALSTPFDPEFVWNYEGGIKSEWFDRRLRVNATAYQMNYENLQTRQFNQITLSQTIVNAGGAEIRGVDLETQVAVTSWLTAGASYSYIDAAFTNFKIGTTVHDGKRPAQTPEHAAHLFADVAYPMPNLGGTVSFGVDWTYRSEVWFDFTNSDPAEVYDNTVIDGLINLRAGWESEDGGWQVQLWGKNVNDRRFFGLGANVAAIYATTTEFFTPPSKYLYVNGANDPATYGVTVTRRW